MKPKSEIKLTKKGLQLIVGVMIGLMFLYTVLSLSLKRDEDLITIFDKSALIVQSESMSGTFEKSDLIYFTSVDYRSFDYGTLEVNDVISYQVFVMIDDVSISTIQTHRIVDTMVDINGKHYFYTQGDANATPEVYPISEIYILGIWNGHVWHGVGNSIGNLIDFFKSVLGFVLCCLIPNLFILACAITRFAKDIIEYKIRSNPEWIHAEAMKLAKAQWEAENHIDEVPKDLSLPKGDAR